ncbi:MAG TPA: tripartite tricarboxylate transporter substrate-binding protein [Burkholderiales bacterium]|nr:tripartite tricarboxylate transporter substrate-binding protein [Burkholderiales bacterium]
MMTKISTCASALLLVAASAAAQDYPSKQVSLAVPFAAGGPTDTLARNLAVAMTQQLKQQVIIENVAGAGGTIAANRIAKAKPDGYSLLLAHIGMATAPALYRKLPYNPLTDYEYIGQVADVPMTLIARTGLPPDNLKELIAYVKINKTKLNLGNAGLGAASHLCGLLFMSRIEAEIQTIPYNGTAPAMTALMGGQIDLMCDQTTNTTAQIKSGRVKVYGTTTKTRVPSLSMVPTLAEQGLKDFDVSVWHGVYAPKGTPKVVVDKLVAALQASVQDAQFKARIAELGAEAVSKDKATPESLAKHLKAEIEKWGPIIKKAGVYAD